jgi:hypothetical protein
MRLINLFTLIVLCVSQVYSASTEETTGTIDPFELFQNAKPVVLIIKDIDPEVCKQQFDAFHEAKNLERVKTEEYKIVEYYAASLFRSSQSTACSSPLGEIQDWISRSVLVGQQGVVHNQEEYFVLAWKMLLNYLVAGSKN